MASGRLDVVIDDIALAELVDTFTPVEDRLGRFSADLHLEMHDTLSIDSRNDLLLPFIGRMRLEPSTLRFESPQADTELTLRLAASDGENGDRRFYLEGKDATTATRHRSLWWAIPCFTHVISIGPTRWTLRPSLSAAESGFRARSSAPGS